MFARRWGAAAVVGWLALPASAHGQEPRPFGKLDCRPADGVRYCEGSRATRVPTFDGVVLDVNVTLPAGGAAPYPLVIQFHGFGGMKRRLDEPFPHEGPKRLAQRGMAVLSFTARGFRESCGYVDARAADPAGCARGWIHLDDVRYEVRDGQHLAGLLVDEGLVRPDRIGAWADSYGGAPSLMLAMLRDRMVLGALPGEANGVYAPWRSPKGTAMEIAAATPYQTWSDLPAALAPNGRPLDHTVPLRAESGAPLGVLKASFVSGLYLTGQVTVPGGQPIGYYAPPGVDPDADLSTWVPRLLAGEPYEGDAQVRAIADGLVGFHSALWVEPPARGPAPMLLSSGWPDDLFSVLEMLRVRNRVQASHPDAIVALSMSDFGHQRGQDKQEDVDARNLRAVEWLDHFLTGSGERPFAGIETRAFTCPKSAPSGERVRASTWGGLHPGEVRAAFPGPFTVLSVAGDPRLATVTDPVAAGNNPCATASAADQGSGVATLRLPAAPAEGWTLLGSPAVAFDVRADGTFPQLAARLWDVAPDGTQRLVTRGVLRLAATTGRVGFQLWPTHHRFESGHVPKLELLGRDEPYLRPSNGAFALALSAVELRLPVRERAGATGVAEPLAAVVPAGASLAPDLPPPPATRRGARLRVAVLLRCSSRGLQVSLSGRAVRSVRRLEVVAGKVRLASDRRRPFSITLRGRSRRKTTTVRVRFADGWVQRVSRRSPRCS